MRSALADYLSEALQVDLNEIQVLLWNPPRPLLTVVLPTLRRRLRWDWQDASTGTIREHADFQAPYAPLPDFVPSRLFADLSLPEVMVHTPVQQRGDDDREDPMPVQQALKEFAPGRVSKRFGVRHKFARHWVPISDDKTDQDVAIDEAYRCLEELGTFQYRDHDGTTREIRCVRPHEIHAVLPPTPLLDSSSSVLAWDTQILPEDGGRLVDVPRSGPWGKLIEGVTFHTHSQRSGVRVRRFSRTASAQLRFQGGREHSTDLRFVDTRGDVPEAVALGFVKHVDAVRVRMRIPKDLGLTNETASPAKLRALRTDYFQESVTADESLPSSVNYFQRGWLSLVYQGALVHRALVDAVDLEEACNRLHAADPEAELDRVLTALFQSASLGDDAQQGEAQGLHVDLAALFKQPEVLDTPTCRSFRSLGRHWVGVDRMGARTD